jgi:hypothetical protein
MMLNVHHPLNVIRCQTLIVITLKIHVNVNIPMCGIKLMKIVVHVLQIMFLIKQESVVGKLK